MIEGERERVKAGREKKLIPEKIRSQNRWEKKERIRNPRRKIKQCNEMTNNLIRKSIWDQVVQIMYQGNKKSAHTIGLVSFRLFCGVYNGSTGLKPDSKYILHRKCIEWKKKHAVENSANFSTKFMQSHRHSKFRISFAQNEEKRDRNRMGANIERNRQKMQVSLCPKKLYIWNTIYAGGKRRDRQYHGIGEYPISLALSLNIFFHHIFASTASLSTYILACFLASTLKISTAPRRNLLNIIVELEKRETRTSAKHSLNIDVKVLLTAKLCSRKSIKFNKVRILKSWLVGWLVGWSFLE